MLDFELNFLLVVQNEMYSYDYNIQLFMYMEIYLYFKLLYLNLVKYIFIYNCMYL